MQTFRLLLRRADKLILESNFDEAWLELAEAAKLQPNHAMLLAFKERLELTQRAGGREGSAGGRGAEGLNPTNGKSARSVLVPDTIEPRIKLEGEKLQQEFALDFQTKLLQERESIRREYEAKEAALEESFRRQTEERRAKSERKLEEQLADLRNSSREEFERKLTALRADVEAEIRGRYEGKLAEEREKLKAEIGSAVEAENNRRQEETDQKVREQMDLAAEEYRQKMELLGAKIPDTKQERMIFYREKLRTCYEKGQPSDDDEKGLVQLRELLQLKPDDHLAAESDVRLELYVDAVARKIRSGELNLGDTTALEDIKMQFRITSEESSRLEPYILSTFQRLTVKGRILLVDDDQQLSNSLARLLSDHGFQAIQAPNIQSALEKLGSTSIDLILSEFRFAAGELDGFKFFKMLADQPHSNNIPFVLMSAMADSVIIRSGMQLGVDGYLTKPIDPDMLICVIEGKLKRYRSFPPRC